MCSTSSGIISMGVLSLKCLFSCVMMLIQGTKCTFPCPFCLVPFEEFWDLLKTYEMHTTKQHQEVLVLYEQKKSASEKKLKSLGLHPIKNIFWLVEHSEPEQAASFEPLHSLHGSLGGKHMHEELKIVANELGHDFETCLEEWYDNSIGLWGCLTITQGFCLSALKQNVRSHQGNLIRIYLQLETLIRLDIHTEATLGMIEHELPIFSGELKVYQSCVHHLHDTGLKDNWNFPKAHLWKHVTHDIQRKGTVHNYSAWPNEKMHGLLKDAYQDCSNGKDVAGQVHIKSLLRDVVA
ncbi:hypothetical protein F5J12DRAFT_784485 [Pisolithus orientalis]|uniref:uncharacterized protein n=1 Tax=Pisolithus orientalis TaxID=936130 RepID=UPI0022254641|nr:uncharacterized protein F5J12DRAFT_784485 [Pisolithus orientalis]KAI6000175.1 hypothetical protein F5J12DRAFT_784485 [Pisolithus orientalis]